VLSAHAGRAACMRYTSRSSDQQLSYVIRGLFPIEKSFVSVSTAVSTVESESVNPCVVVVPVTGTQTM